MADTCKWGHPTPLASDRDRSGFCKRCRSKVNAENYRRRKARENANRELVQLMQQAL